MHKIGFVSLNLLTTKLKQAIVLQELLRHFLPNINPKNNKVETASNGRKDSESLIDHLSTFIVFCKLFTLFIWFILLRITF